MPLNNDPENGGTNSDNTKSNKYCSFCYRNGVFLDEGITLQQKIEKNIGMAVSMGMLEEQAREMAESILPELERWR
jgi:hypothetical protein